MRAPRLSRLLTVGVLAMIGLAFPQTTAGAEAQPLVITTTHLPDARIATPYTATLKATGGNWGRVWSLAGGTLPTGLKLSAQGRISGTPTQEGPAAFTVSVHDTANPRQTTSAVVDLTVAPVQVTTASLPVATDGIKYSAQLTASGGTKPYTWAIVEGQLPGGLTMTSAGKLGGSPAFFSGTEDFTVQVTDKAHRTAVRSYTLVSNNMSVTTTAVPAAKKGRYYSARMKAYGGCTSPTWTVHDENYQGFTNGGQGILPDGLLIGPYGVISGVPKTTGTYPFTVLARCGNNVFSFFAWSTVMTLTVT